jgi:hypothetical protein
MIEGSEPGDAGDVAPIRPFRKAGTRPARHGMIRRSDGETLA